MFEKKFFLKRIRIRQEMDLKIPKALSNRVFDNGYSKHFRAVAFLWGVRGVQYPPPPPNQNFEAKVLNFAVLSFGSRILSFSFKFYF